MLPDAHPQTSSPAPRGGVEPDGVNVKGIVLFLVGLAFAMVVVHLIVSTVFLKLKRRAALEDQQFSQREVAPSVAATRAYFPAPHEQIAPELDLKAWRAQQDAELNSYGWVDRNAGVVRIPIECALELISERGLPTRAQSNTPATGPSTLQLQQQRPVQSSPPQKEEGR